ncbi:glycoside hydrolase family 6 protein [Nocardioides ferulae]|uniref:glycoside hydrolase family 6 protein n=1 Tax=Nocardioides ferulae TaxID=2340821 RepID=UPI0013DE3103|nr:glycoside hydrolase family 6 protein [Nocardioides ferulae]
MHLGNSHHPRRDRRRPHRLAAALAAGALAIGVLTTAPSSAGASRASTAPSASEASAPDERRARAGDNPLAGHRMGVYKGPMEQAWEPYQRASGKKKRLLAKIALRPKAKWFGAWIPARDIAGKVRDYIENSTGGDPDVLVQMTVFRMVPWEQETCQRLPTRKERRAYKHWIRRFASAIDDTHTAIILQPDGPFALCAPGGSKVPSRLVAYAAEELSRPANSSVYIDVGASDWPKDDPETAATILVRGGIEHARGFALNATHYVSVADDIEHGARVVDELARRGHPGKHFVVNTAQNGRPFLFGEARGSHPNNAKVCATKRERKCVTLGIPPTTAVAAERWGLSAENRRRAREHVDGYLWFGRPWLHMQTDPFSMKRALAVARTTPY